MNQFHTRKGITLLALVITVIIMLILAGVVISMLIGENGIITKAKYARDKYWNATDDEQDNLDDLEDLFSKILVANNSTVELSMEQLNTYIDQRVNQKLTETNTSNPTGTVISYMGNNAPTGYLKCDGTVYNIADYKELAEQIKNEFNSYNYYGGDGTTTFAVPDLRGEFLRGTGTNSHANQGSGTNVGIHQDATRHVSVYGWQNQQIAINIANQSTTGSNVSISNVDSGIGRTGLLTNDASKDAFISYNFQSTVDYSTYTSRPTNTSVLYCIKY